MQSKAWTTKTKQIYADFEPNTFVQINQAHNNYQAPPQKKA